MPGSGRTLPERREFLRLNFKKPFKFKSFFLEKSGANKTQAPDSGPGLSQNISSSGILFQTQNSPPKLSSILWIDLDFRLLNICHEIERKALIFNNGLLGRVVRVEENPQNNQVYDVGVCFLTQDQDNSRQVRRFLAELSKETK